jgi:AsmA protein
MLDLTLEPKTRNTSPVALRSPIYVKGSFSSPEVAVDKTHVVVRGAGAVALGLVSPLLALIPLIEMGPGVENECGRLIKAARTHSSTTPTPAN